MVLLFGRTSPGPLGAAVASEACIGWNFTSGHALLCDNSGTVDLFLNPSIVVAEAVQRAG
jgi:hypothetical protein